jgi:hypothetical protein
VIGVRAQDKDVVRGQGRERREAVEAVVLDLAPRNRHQRVLGDRLDALDVGDRARRAHAEVVHEHRVLAGALDLVGLLVEDLEPEVLEHGQAPRERHRGARTIDAQAQRPVVALHRPVEAHRVGVARIQALHRGHVAHRGAPARRRPIAHRKRGGVRAPERGRALLAHRLDERCLEVVLPAPARLRDVGLDRAQVEVGGLLGRGAHQHVDARERGLREMHGELHARAAEVALQDLLDLHAHVGVEALARQVDEARVEAAVDVAADEGTGLAPVAQAKDPQRGLVERLLVDLEELVAGVCLEHREQVLVRVAVLAEARALDHVRDLAADERHLARIGGVGRGGVEADEPALAHDLPLGVEALHSDVVEVSRTMDGRARVGLGEHQQPRLARERAKLLGKLTEARRDAAQPGLPQDPEAAARQDPQLVLAVHARELVVAVAEEGEMVVGGPGEERADLRGLLLVEARGGRLELLDDVLHPRAHRLPVLVGGAHVGQHVLDALAEVLELRGVDFAIDLDVDERLGLALVGRGREGSGLPLGVALRPEDRVVEQVQRVALAVHLHGHRVHQERHVVVHGLDHGVRARPAVLVHARVVDAKLRRPAGEAAGDGEVRHGRPVQVLHVAGGEVLGVDAVVVVRDERPRFLRRRARQALVGDAQDLLEEGLLLLVAGKVHARGLTRGNRYCPPTRRWVSWATKGVTQE